jgi:carboxypeptidase C (cathepsin A)
MLPNLPGTLFTLSWLLFSTPGRTEFPPPISSDSMTVLASPIDGNITISYKSPPVGTCTTVFSTQKQYTGYVSLPPNILSPSQGNYSINTFFWFIEARQLPETAPLTIYMNGGPGSSSMVGMFQEVGPCQVVEIAQGRLGTQARDWGWDRSTNILFVDQPVQVGFSYDVATNASLNLVNEAIYYPPSSVPKTQPPYTFLNGTFGSGNPASTANTSEIAARSVWHLLQAFLGTFPQYNPGNRPNGSANNNIVGVNLFTESYGGKYGPAFASFFQSQNTLRLNTPALINQTLEINLVSLGIINGWIDLIVQSPFYPRFAYNNTYGIQAISLVDELNAANAFLAADGCQQLASSCRATEASMDPMDLGNIDAVNNACSQAQAYCESNVVGPYTLSGRSVYDISQSVLNPFPDSHYLEYLNTLAVQQAIGAPVNYTQDSLTVFGAFKATGDYARNGILEDLAVLLESGVRIALIYGDRDYICNWLGGEAISFAIAAAVQPQYAQWYATGYAPIVVNESYVGGVVREFGNLSFSRIYDAGHLVPAYQPETAFTVFTRIIQGVDISLGIAIDLSSFGTEGDTNATQTNIAPPMHSPTCFIRAVNETCNTDQKNMLANGAGVIINGVLYAAASDWQPPAANISTAAGQPGTAPISMMSSAPPSVSTKGGSARETTNTVPTGVYVATGTPTTSATSTGGAIATGLNVQRAMRRGVSLSMLFLGAVCV